MGASSGSGPTAESCEGSGVGSSSVEIETVEPVEKAPRRLKVLDLNEAPEVRDIFLQGERKPPQ